ncbi:predicted protein [Coccidioides posadasii str. Silveira]|uniref:Predicted protein n=1 Tax=Coccidioides posadasii (strain RMSCC 757 / Silveira) TaxID=443226 RepID=E9D4E8_COCPS|nr:predicted protein [Coccidioides posadasii str. Silveira]
MAGRFRIQGSFGSPNRKDKSCNLTRARITGPVKTQKNQRFCKKGRRPAPTQQGDGRGKESDGGKEEDEMEEAEEREEEKVTVVVVVVVVRATGGTFRGETACDKVRWSMKIELKRKKRRE